MDDSLAGCPIDNLHTGRSGQELCGHRSAAEGEQMICWLPHLGRNAKLLPGKPLEGFDDVFCWTLQHSMVLEQVQLSLACRPDSQDSAACLTTDVDCFSAISRLS